MYGKGERDMILMRHEVTVRWPDGRREMKGINLVEYGDPAGYTAMARTVNTLCAVSCNMYTALWAGGLPLRHRHQDGAGRRDSEAGDGAPLHTGYLQAYVGPAAEGGNIRHRKVDLPVILPINVMYL